jgi:uncharacterized coiled-coil protein SlyX
VNGVLTIVQSEMTFRVEKEAFETAMDQKLDKDEFYARANDNGIGEDSLKKLELEFKKMSKQLGELDEEVNKKLKKLKKKAEGMESTQQDQEHRIKDLEGRGSEQVDTVKPAEVSDNGGKNVREELDDFSRTLARLNSIISRIRNDQLRALASCRNALCLSCGRGDVNFMPPIDYIKGTNGNYYRTDGFKDPNLYDHGQDVFTKEEVCKEHTVHAHIPVDTLLQSDLDLVDKARAFRKSPLGGVRPATASNTRRFGMTQHLCASRLDQGRR